MLVMMSGFDRRLPKRDIHWLDFSRFLNLPNVHTEPRKKALVRVGILCLKKAMPLLHIGVGKPDFAK
jgi:hypothetical protein